MEIECIHEYNNWLIRLKKFVCGEIEDVEFSVEDFAKSHPGIAPDVFTSKGTFDIEAAHNKVDTLKGNLGRRVGKKHKPQPASLKELFALCKVTDKTPNFFLLEPGILEDNLYGVAENSYAGMSFRKQSFAVESFRDKKLLREIILTCKPVESWVNAIIGSPGAFTISKASLPEKPFFLELFFSEIIRMFPLVFWCEGCGKPDSKYGAPYWFNMRKAKIDQKEFQACCQIINHFVRGHGNKKADRIIDSDFFVDDSCIDIEWNMSPKDVEEYVCSKEKKQTLHSSDDNKGEGISCSKSLELSVNFCLLFCALLATVKLTVYHCGVVSLESLKDDRGEITFSKNNKFIENRFYKNLFDEYGDVLCFITSLLSDSFVVVNQYTILNAKGENICASSQEQYKKASPQGSGNTENSADNRENCEDDPLKRLKEKEEEQKRKSRKQGSFIDPSL